VEIIAKFKALIVLLLIVVNVQTISAQTKADIFDKKVPVTWLGVDYSQAKVICSDSKEITTKSGFLSSTQFKLVYTPQWNNLFIYEKDKYDVAGAVHRDSVKYAIDVTAKANLALGEKEFFSTNPADFKTLNETKIADLVKNYDFGGNDGIGLIFFVEGMSKSKELMGVWATFVDMKSKTVLLTKYGTGKPGGFGLRNYWASPLYAVLGGIRANFKKWQKDQGLAN